MEQPNATPPDAATEEPLVVPEPPPLVEAPEAQPHTPWHERLRSGLAGRLQQRGVSPPILALSALVPAGLGALCLIIDHPGLGGLSGLLALGAAWIATAPPEATAAEPHPEGAGEVALLGAHAVMPLLLGGVVMAAAADGAPARAGLAAWGAFVLLLLPLLRAVSADGRLTKGPLLWSWTERGLAILAGMLLGHVSLTLFVTALVATGDLVLRLALLQPRGAERPALAGTLGRLFGTDGEAQPGVRLAGGLALALLVVLCVALGPTEGWRF